MQLVEPGDERPQLGAGQGGGPALDGRSSSAQAAAQKRRDYLAEAVLAHLQ
ncbi:hypothetical protein [Variovorax saccharolyticus]|uniref:hypothetical protein n=1 Tax=Variovorax saccharolyticus TaxID=3053516 RepID=UPI002577123A|nr:hypothetical protein [Variovorax sp. J22R187]MDM0020949.1 hypothetical protein [Variovorax sp. J22R187]